MGKVYLIGAGPGDVGLLTMRGYELLKKADAVVYDRLVGEDVLSLVNESAVMINVGKNAGFHAVTQEQTNQILVDCGNKYDITVRLKGGDPFVFGRGGEELEKLVSNNIQFEVIPGITSSISAPTYAGIPVTHRDYCSSFHIITGHAKEGSELDIDFSSLVKLKGTLIFMMSVSSLAMIVDGLLTADMGKDMPCAIIENATRPNQRKFVGTLATIVDIASENAVKSPSVIVVGKVCALSDKFDSFGKKPLNGRNIIVTQPVKKANKLRDALAERGAKTLLLPCIRTENLTDINTDINSFDTVVFTSEVGVNAFFENLFANSGDARVFAGKKVACVGGKTASELKKYGIVADFIPTVYDGESLAKEMLESGFISNTSSVVLLRAENASSDITEILGDSGIVYEDRVMYKTHYCSENKVELQKYDLVTFTSKSCVEGFVNIQGSSDFTGVRAVCIGAKTSTEAQKYGFDVTISDQATIESMAEKIVSLFEKG